MRLTTLVGSLVLVLSLAACKSNRFVGTWKPDENQRNVVMQTLEVKKDGAWVLTTYKDRFTGTYKIVGETLQMTEERAVRHTVEASIESDGRLKLIEGDKAPLYLKRSS